MILNGEFKTLVRNGVTVSPRLQKIWAVELDLLEKLIAVLDKYNISYFAGGGTLLGAVRHKGFIPWDDDIDIFMLREDYDKLLEVAPKEFSEPYFFQTAYTDIGYFRGHAQLRRSDTTGMLAYEAKKVKFNQGIFIDIFPLDNIPDKKEDALSQKKLLRALNRTLNSGARKSNESDFSAKQFAKKLFSNTVSVFYSYKSQYRLMENVCKMYNSKKTKRVGLLSFDPNNEKFCFDAAMLEDFIMLDFEHLKIRAPKNYDALLCRMYGDWHKMKKEPNYHGRTIFNTKIGYKEYLKHLKK